MKVFIGSSAEATEDLRLISSWIEELGMEPLPWDDPRLFLPGENTLLKLIEISKSVDAAIFIFGEDDHVWYRADGMAQPRDNVLLEYGLFAGVLGPKRAIICRKGQPKTASDLHGITLVNVDFARRETARVRLLAWARSLGQQTEDPAITELIMQREVLKREKDELSGRLVFEQQKSRDLARIVGEATTLDFGVYDLSADGHWKLLFDYDYFWQAVRVFTRDQSDPEAWRATLNELALTWVTSVVSSEFDKNTDRTGFFVAKTLRVLRLYERNRAPSEYLRLVKHLPPSANEALTTVAHERIRELSRETQTQV